MKPHILKSQSHRQGMFDNLKEQITKENINAIKRKNRYLEDSHQQSEPKKSLKQKHQVELYPKKSNQSDSSDSLSDYELEERQEIFNQLIDHNQYESSPQHKNLFAYSDHYFTPQSKLKELQRSVELSQEKLKLSQQYHERQISNLTQKHSLSVKDLQIQIQKLNLIINKSDHKQLRIRQLMKENCCLRDSLTNYQQKYWKAQQTEQLLIGKQTQNQILKTELIHLKDLLNQTKTLCKFEEKKVSTQHNQENENSKIKHQQKIIGRLERRINDLQNQTQMDKLHFQQVISSWQKKYQDQEQIIRNKQKSLIQCHLTVQKLKLQKQKIEKSLLLTMDSFSKHLTNESAQNSQSMHQHQHQHQNRHIYFRGAEGSKITQQSLKPYQVGLLPEETINLSMNESFQKKQNKKTFHDNHPELTSISPVPRKKYQIACNQTRFLTHHDYLKSVQDGPTLKQIETQKIFQRNTRIMSHNVTSQRRSKERDCKLVDVDQSDLRNDPQKEEYNKITRLERKLDIANLKIMELLRQKLQRGYRIQIK